MNGKSKPLLSEINLTFNLTTDKLKFSKADIEDGNIDRVLSDLEILVANSTAAKRYQGALKFERVFDDVSTNSLDRLKVESFLKELDRKFPYWFYFLDVYDTEGSLEFIYHSLCYSYNNPVTNKIIVPPDIREKFMKEHFDALEKIFNLVEEDIQKREEIRRAISEYFCRLTGWDDYPG